MYTPVMYYTPFMYDFTTEDRYWIEQEDQKKKKRLKGLFSFLPKNEKFCPRAMGTSPGR